MNDTKNATRDEQAKEYDSIQNRLFLVQIFFVGTLLAVYFFTGASAALADGLARRFGESHWYLTNALYTLVTVFGFSACMFPLSYYSGYTLERHYDLTNETFGDWIFDFFKSLMLDLILATVLFSVLYALLRWMPNWWWVFATVFYILFAVIISTLAPILIMPLFHKFEPMEESELTAAVRDMMSGAGIKIIGIYKWGLEEKTKTANAAFAGFGKTKRIILGDTLLSGYTREEILAILSHEVGHYKNRDMFRLMVTSSVLALIGFYISHCCLVGLSGIWGFEHIYDIGAAPLFIFSLFIFSLVSMPFANMHSRRREFAADAYAVEQMGSSDALVSAFEKLADQNLSNKEPNPLVEFLLHSHPSIHRRIARVREPKPALAGVEE